MVLPEKKEEKKKTLFGIPVAMEMKDQDVSHRGMVTSGRERPCVFFAFSRYNYTTEG